MRSLKSMIFAALFFVGFSARADFLLLGGSHEIPTSARGHTAGDYSVAIMVGQGDGFDLCTGTILDKSLILTSAHCVIQNGLPIEEKLIHVTTGENAADPKSGVVYNVKRLAVHPSFTMKSATDYNFDLALIKIDGVLPSYKKAVQLPDLYFFDQLAKMISLVAVGYGSTSDSTVDTTAGILRYSNQIEVSDNWLNLKLPMLLVADQSKGIGTCLGDSGGPLLTRIGFDVYLAGVTANGMLTPLQEADRRKLSLTINEYLHLHPDIDICRDFGGYVNVAYHLDFLSKVINAWK